MKKCSDDEALVTILNKALNDREGYHVCEPREMKDIMDYKKKRWTEVPKLNYRDCFQVHP